MTTDKASPAKKSAAPPEELPRKPLVRQLLDFIFGYDFFITYFPLDGKTYAAALYKQLVGRGYACRIKTPKRWEKSESWDLLGRWALRRSNVLIVVGTKGALSSLIVQREVKRFYRRRSKRIIPISFDGTLDRSLPRKGLLEFISSKLPRINATAAELATGPTPAATERLSRIFDITRQGTKRTRLTLALSLACAGAAVYAGLQWQLTVHRFEVAKQARYESDMALVQSLWDSSDWSSVIPLLERHHPSTGNDSRRGFEWSYRWLQLRMPVPTLQVHSGEVQNLSCSPDGKMVAIASRAGLVSLRSLSTGKLILNLDCPADEVVKTSAFSPDGRYVAGLTESKQLRLWDPLTGKQIKSWTSDKPNASAFAFSEGGSSIVVETTNGIDICQVEGGSQNPQAKLRDDAEEPLSDTLVFSEDGRQVVRLKKDFVVESVIAQTRKATEVGTARGDAPYMAKFSPDGSLLAIQADDQSIHVREMGSGLELTSRDKPLTASSMFYGMAFDAHNRFLAVGCGDGTIRVWDFRTGDVVADYKASSVRIFSVVFTPEGNRVIGGSLNGEVRMFLLNSPDANLTVSTGEKGTAGKDNDVSLAFSPDGLTLATCAAGDSVRIFGLVDGKERTRIQTRQGTILAMEFSDDGRKLGTLGLLDNNNSFNWWNINDTPPTLSESRICDIGQASVVLTADGEWLLALGYQPGPEARMLDIKKISVTGAERIVSASLDADIGPGVINQVNVNPQGTLLAAVFSSDRGPGTVTVADIATGKSCWLKRYRDEMPKGVAFSPDSKLVAVESDLGHVWLYDVQTGSETLALQSSKPTEDRLAVGGGPVRFDQSGRRIVTAGGDGSLRIWDTALGTEMLGVKLHKRDILNVVVGAKDHWIATKSRDKTVRVLRGTTQTLVQAPLPTAVPEPAK